MSKEQKLVRAYLENGDRKHLVALKLHLDRMGHDAAPLLNIYGTAYENRAVLEEVGDAMIQFGNNGRVTGVRMNTGHGTVYELVRKEWLE